MNKYRPHFAFKVIENIPATVDISQYKSEQMILKKDNSTETMVAFRATAISNHGDEEFEMEPGEIR